MSCPSILSLSISIRSWQRPVLYYFLVESICSIEFSENDFENSVQLKIDGMANPCAETMDKPFKCVPCQLSKPGRNCSYSDTDSNEYQEISDPAIANIWL